MANGIIGLPSLWDAFSMVITYVWSRYFPDVVVSFLLGIRFKAKYLPIALLAMDAVMGGGVSGGLMGILIGHLYYFTKEEWPNGRHWVRPFPWFSAMYTSGGKRRPDVKTPYGSAMAPRVEQSQRPKEQGSNVFKGVSRRLGD